MAKKDDDALAESLKYGSGPAEPRWGSVEGFDQYGIAPVVLEEVSTKSATPAPAESATKKAS